MTTIDMTTTLPQTYAVTKSTPIMRDLLREAFSNNKGKLFTVPDLQKLTGKKWVNGFIYYTSRASLHKDAPTDFNIVAVKNGRRVVGYRHQDVVAADVTAQGARIKYRNTKGHIVKPTNFVGKWEARLDMTSIANAMNPPEATETEVAAEAAA